MNLILQEKVLAELIYSQHLFHLLLFYFIVFVIVILLKIYIFSKKIYLFNKLTLRSKKIILSTFFLRKDNEYIQNNLIIPWEWYLAFKLTAIDYLNQLNNLKK